MSLSALVFDTDGTLAETADVKRAAFNQAFYECGLDWVWGRATYAQIRANCLPGSEIEFYGLLRFPDKFNQWEKEGLLDEAQAIFRGKYLSLLESGAAPLRPGVARLMSEARLKGRKIAICSTAPREEFETLLFNRFGLEMIDALAASVSAEDLQGVSPIQAYRLCFERLSVPARRIAVIEDSARGLVAAASLGAQVILTPGLYSRGQNFQAAKLVVSDLGHPSQPMTQIAGPTQQARLVDIALLDRLIDEASTFALPVQVAA